MTRNRVHRRAALLMQAVAFGLLFYLLLTWPVWAQPAAPGPHPGHGYTKGTDADGIPFLHGVVDQGNMTYATVTVGTASTPVLAAPLGTLRTKLYLLNASGRGSGTAVDVWCSYGSPAVVGQGFILMGYGDRTTEDMAATIDQRALACIAPSPVVITVGAVQQ